MAENMLGKLLNAAKEKFSENELIRLRHNFLEDWPAIAEKGEAEKIELILPHAIEIIKFLPNKENRSQLCEAVAGQLLSQKKYKTARSYFKKALEYDFKNRNAHSQIALCYINENRLKDAYQHINNAIKYLLQDYKKYYTTVATSRNIREKELREDVFSFYYLRAGIRSRFNDSYNSIKDYKVALKKGIGDKLKIYPNIGLEYLAVNDKKSAKDFFKKYKKETRRAKNSANKMDVSAKELSN